jgi:hypothetical protein
MNILNKPYTTHIPMLVKCVQHTTGPVLELGAGPASTPLLHWLCQEPSRPLYTYESTKYFYRYAHLFQSKNHRIRLVDWNNYKIDGKWSVALIDQPSQYRIQSIKHLKDRVDIFVLHDTDGQGEKKYKDILSQFKYRHDWKACRPWTTVVSNTNDLSWL